MGISALGHYRSHHRTLVDGPATASARTRARLALLQARHRHYCPLCLARLNTRYAGLRDRHYIGLGIPLHCDACLSRLRADSGS